MLKTVLLTTLLATSSAFAAVTVVPFSKDKVSLARVEKVINLSNNGANITAVRLVQVDNGGSTDMSSFLAPSRLYLAVFQQGEMYDTEAQYEVLYGIKSFEVEDVDLKAGTVLVSVVQVNEEEVETTKYLKLSISEAIKGTAANKVKGTSVEVEDVTPAPVDSRH